MEILWKYYLIFVAKLNLFNITEYDCMSQYCLFGFQNVNCEKCICYPLSNNHIVFVIYAALQQMFHL